MSDSAPSKNAVEEQKNLIDDLGREAMLGGRDRVAVVAVVVWMCVIIAVVVEQRDHVCVCVWGGG